MIPPSSPGTAVERPCLDLPAWRRVLAPVLLVVIAPSTQMHVTVVRYVHFCTPRLPWPHAPIPYPARRIPGTCSTAKHTPTARLLCLFFPPFFSPTVFFLACFSHMGGLQFLCVFVLALFLPFAFFNTYRLVHTIPDTRPAHLA